MMRNLSESERAEVSQRFKWFLFQFCLSL